MASGMDAAVEKAALCTREKETVSLALHQADSTWPQASSVNLVVLMPRWQQKEFEWARPEHRPDPGTSTTVAALEDPAEEMSPEHEDRHFVDVPSASG